MRSLHLAGVALRYVQPLTHGLHAGPADGRGLEVSLCRLLQDQLIQGKIGDRLPEPLILLLQLLQALGWETDIPPYSCRQR